MLLIRTEFNAPYPIAFQYLGPPIVVLCLFIGVRYKSEFIARARTKASYWLVLIFLPPLAVLMSGGLVIAANAWLPPQRTIVVEGVVQNKWVAGARYKSLVVDLATATGPRRLEVSRAEYDGVTVGKPFRADRRIGPLGFAYTWR